MQIWERRNIFDMASENEEQYQIRRNKFAAGGFAGSPADINVSLQVSGFDQKAQSCAVIV